MTLLIKITVAFLESTAASLIYVWVHSLDQSQFSHKMWLFFPTQFAADKETRFIQKFLFYYFNSKGNKGKLFQNAYNDHKTFNQKCC